MSPETIFRLQLILGYVACWLGFSAYVFPRLKQLERVDAHRAIATFHSFRFFGLVFMLPGVIGPNLPAAFGNFAAYWDLATGVIAMLALVSVRWKPLFWTFVLAFNVVGTIDLLLDYYHAIVMGVPASAGQFAATYAIPILYVPALMITHITAFYLLLRPHTKSVPGLTAEVVPTS